MFRRLPAASVLILAATLPALALAQGKPPRPAVTVAEVEQADINPPKTYVGHVIAIQSVSIVPRVTAFIDSVPVKQGSDVEAGEVLFELQKAQYEDAEKAAKAQLANAEAALKLADVSLSRAQQLAKQEFESIANLNQAQATQAQDVANVQAQEANLAQAELNLGYCTIRSPIKGRIGPVTLTEGNLVTPSTPSLATVVQLDPIRVEFPVSDEIIIGAEQQAGTSASKIAKGLVVNLILPDGKPYSHPGNVAFLSNQVEQQTGSVNVYADFPNPDELLLPGAYVNVEVRRAKPEMRALVPVAAVQTEQQGDFVLVVGPDDKVRQQSVELGQQVAQSFVVQKGLAVGDRVIVAGIQKVKPGEVVTATLAPSAPDQADATGISQ